MNKMKKFLVLVLALVISLGSIGALPVSADEDGVKPKKVSITKKTMTVYVGDEFEIGAKMNPTYADDDYLRWRIVSGSKYIKFDDDDRNDDEAEFRAVKAGTAKVRVYIKGYKTKNTKGKYDTITVKVKKATSKLTRVGSATRTVEVDDDLELRVKATGVSGSKLKWTIANTKILRFDEGRYGKEVEVEARRTGKTKVTCKNTVTGKKVSFTVKVVPEYDD